MTHEKLMTERAVTQIQLAAEQIGNGNSAQALVMLDNAVKQVKQISGSPEEKLLDSIFNKEKISISISKDLLKKIKNKATELELSVSTCICLVLKGEIKL